MIKSTFDPACTGQFSSLFLDYIRQKQETFSFYNEYPEISNFENLIKGKNFSLSNRQTLVSSLHKQYEGFEGEGLLTEQISSLGDSKTFTVTTGHQLNLFTGPLYFIYKIVATINLAERLKKAYPDKHFVPVYWMATEDHDFDEINYFKLEGKKYQWKSSQTGAVGDFELDDGFRAFFKEVAFFVPDFFKEAYQKSEKLSEAVRKYVHHLFGERGLLIVDGNDAALKRLFIPVMQEDLENQSPSRFAGEQSNKLEELGYKSQIYPRDINLFYMVKGVRERIEKKDTTYKVLNTDISFSEKEILEELDRHPERFSPNVVLRPLYQEVILPNLAYLGGPAEVIYWLQLKSMFDHFEVQFPAIMPRNFAVILDTVVSRKIKQLGLEDQQLFETVLDWKKAFVLNNAVLDFQFEKEKESLSGIFDKTGKKTSELEKSLGNAFEAGKVRALKIMDQLSKKVRKAEERRQAVQIRRREEIQELLFPSGSPQERVENFMRFYLESPGFLDELFELFDPFDFNYMILKAENG